MYVQKHNDNKCEGPLGSYVLATAVRAVATLGRFLVLGALALVLEVRRVAFF